MSARAIISGTLAKLPIRRVSKAQKTYLVATVRDREAWWSVLIFDELDIATLEAMSVGEPIAVAGAFEATVWSPGGRGPRVNLSLMADAILTARHEPKPRPEPAPAARVATGGDLEDQIPL